MDIIINNENNCLLHSCCNQFNLVIFTIWQAHTLLVFTAAVSGYAVCFYLLSTDAAGYTSTALTSCPMFSFLINHTYTGISCLVHYAYTISQTTAESCAVTICTFCCFSAEEHHSPPPPSNTNIKPFVAINGPVSFDANALELFIPTACWQQTAKYKKSWSMKNIKQCLHLVNQSVRCLDKNLCAEKEMLIPH